MKRAGGGYDYSYNAHTALEINAEQYPMRSRQMQTRLSNGWLAGSAGAAHGQIASETGQTPLHGTFKTRCRAES